MQIGREMYLVGLEIGIALAVSPFIGVTASDLLPFLVVFAVLLIFDSNNILTIITDWRLTIPLLLISAIVGVVGTLQTGNWLYGIYGMSLYAVYVTARYIGKQIFIPFIIGSIIVALWITPVVLSDFGKQTGGLLNVHMFSGYVLLGMAIYMAKWRWILFTLAVEMVLLSNDLEGAFVLVVVGAVVLWRHDWNKKLFWVTLPLAIVTLFALYIIPEYNNKPASAIVQGQSDLYSFGTYTLQNNPEVEFPHRGTPPIQARWETIKYELTHIETFGWGLFGFPEWFDEGKRRIFIHQVPLVLVQQLGWAGIAAAIAWVWVSVFAWFRSKRVYVWIILFALGVFDNFIWDRMGLYWWVLVGVSMSSPVSSDYFFKGKKG